MRIEKTNMEFVEFDAKDIIMTSNQWTGYGMYASISVLNDYNKEYGSSGKYFYTSVTGSAGLGYNPTTKMTSFTPPNTAYGTNFVDWTHEAMGKEYYTENDITYKQANTVQDILDWLEGNNIQ